MHRLACASCSCHHISSQLGPRNASRPHLGTRDVSRHQPVCLLRTRWPCSSLHGHSCVSMTSVLKAWVLVSGHATTCSHPDSQTKQ